MADGAVVIGVVAVLTSGVLGPLVLHHAQKDRDSLADMRAALDAAIEPLAEARATGAWIGAWAFKGGTDVAQLDTRFEELVRQTHLVEAHAVKLTIRFPDSALAEAYTTAGGALQEQSSIVWRRRSGAIPTLAEANRELGEAEQIYLDAYFRFVAEASRWRGERNWPYLPFVNG